MGRAIRFRLRTGARRTLHDLDRLLNDAYGAPEADLDNKADPLDEAVYMVLSFQTDLDRFRSVWDELRAAFPGWESVAQAPLSRVIKTLRAGGLQEQLSWRAAAIDHVRVVLKVERYVLRVLSKQDNS